MRINLADVLAILTILTICFGTAMMISHLHPEKPLNVLGIILGILVMLLAGLKDGGDAKVALHRLTNPEYRPPAWPVGVYAITGLATLVVALMAIVLNVFIEFFLGAPCGWAIGATLARHRNAASITQVEEPQMNADAHG